MKANKMLLDVALARKQTSLTNLRKSGLSPQTLLKVRKGESVLPATLGKIAAALGVDVLELIETGGLTDARTNN